MIPIDLFLYTFLIFLIPTICVPLIVSYLSKGKTPLKAVRIIYSIIFTLFTLYMLINLLALVTTTSLKVNFSNDGVAHINFKHSMPQQYDMNLILPLKIADKIRACYGLPSAQFLNNGPPPAGQPAIHLSPAPDCDKTYNSKYITVSINGKIIPTDKEYGASLIFDSTDLTFLTFNTEANKPYHIVVTLDKNMIEILNTQPTIELVVGISFWVKLVLDFILRYLPFALAAFFTITIYIPKKLRERE